MTQAINGMTLQQMVAPASGSVPDYFRSLGYEVSWDFDKYTGLRWCEVYEPRADPNMPGRMLAQIDQHAPLAEIQRDLPLLARGSAPTSDPDPGDNWEVRGSLEDLKAIVARMSDSPAPDPAGDRHGFETVQTSMDFVMPRPPGCRCHQEVGDSPCPVHGEEGT